MQRNPASSTTSWLRVHCTCGDYLQKGRIWDRIKFQNSSTTMTLKNASPKSQAFVVWVTRRLVLWSIVVGWYPIIARSSNMLYRSNEKTYDIYIHSEYQYIYIYNIYIYTYEIYILYMGARSRVWPPTLLWWIRNMGRRAGNAHPHIYI